MRYSENQDQIEVACNRLRATREMLEAHGHGCCYDGLGDLSSSEAPGFHHTVVRAMALHLQSVRALNLRENLVALRAANQAVEQWSGLAASISSSREPFDVLSLVHCSLHPRVRAREEVDEINDLIATASQRSNLLVAFAFAAMHRLVEAIAIADTVAADWRVNNMRGSQTLYFVEDAVRGWKTRAGTRSEMARVERAEAVLDRHVSKPLYLVVPVDALARVTLLRFANAICLLPSDLKVGRAVLGERQPEIKTPTLLNRAIEIESPLPHWGFQATGF